MPPLFDFLKGNGLDPKLHVTTGELPGYIDASQPPTKKSPWRQINDAPFVQTATMFLPEEMYQLIGEKAQAEVEGVRYAKVIMKLQYVLDGAFFTEYVKRGDVLMLSEGRPGIDNVFTLREGVLRLDLDKESYERSGLQGKAVRSGGRKHVKARYVVEIDLRQPSMLHGKRGFERIVWAAKNVLNRSVTWLFSNMQAETAAAAEAIGQHRPTWVTITATQEIRPLLAVPLSISKPTAGTAFVAHTDEDSHYETVEWLDLLMLGSSRIEEDDHADPFISRYAVPEGDNTKHNVRIVRWQGLLNSKWLTNLLTTVIRLSRTVHADHWLALTTSSHRTEAFGTSDGHVILLASTQGQETQCDADEMVAETSRELQAENKESPTQNLEEKGKKDKGHGGLRRYTCFEFIDEMS